MAKHVRTVLGDISPGELGVTLPHEHLITFPPQKVRYDPDYMLPSAEKALQEVKLFKAAGGNALAEMTTSGYGRDVLNFKKISEETGVHVIATTGAIMESLFPAEIYDLTDSELTNLFIRDVTVGLDNTDIKAGVLKFGASNDSFSSAERKVARAVCKTHLETGAPITTHTINGTMAMSFVEFLQAEGVKLENAVIGHLDKGSLQLGYLLMIARTGVYVQLDSIGKTKYYPDELRVEIIKELIKEGFGNRILISGDMGRQSYLKSYGGAPGFEHLLHGFIPLMREAGISEEDIKLLTVDNPQNFFAF